jgi:hypothetical protein
MYIYEEKQSIAPFFILFSVGILLLLGYATYDIITYAKPMENFIALALVLAFSVFSLVNYRKLSIQISSSELVLRFGLLKSSFFIQNMSQLEKSKDGYRMFKGYGIRRVYKKYFKDTERKRQRLNGYVARKSEGVIFYDTHRNQGVFFTTANADQIIQLLKQYGAKTTGQSTDALR